MMRNKSISNPIKVVTSIKKMKEVSETFRQQNLSIGFVPTMGCLHEGHLSLIKNSLETCDRTLVSIFVNPPQFGPNEDLNTYPRQLKSDIKKLEDAGVDILFHPTSKEMYPSGFNTHIEVKNITRHLCGKSRPNLFKGVAKVVLKLFNIVQPEKAFFGEKDWQQLSVIESLVTDLNLDVAIIRVPIVREPDGLAMSSRNCFLSPRERQAASCLYNSLVKAKDMIYHKTTSTEVILDSMKKIISEQEGTTIDYVTICDPENFEEKKKICGRILIALAVKIGPSRLIDNCIVEKL